MNAHFRRLVLYTLEKFENKRLQLLGSFFLFFTFFNRDPEADDRFLTEIQMNFTAYEKHDMPMN